MKSTQVNLFNSREGWSSPGSPGGHADVAEGDKYTQYGKEYVGLNADSSPALAILAMGRHGSFSKGTLEYCKAAVHVAHERQKTSEFPVHLSVLT